MNTFTDIVNFYKNNPVADIEQDLLPLYSSIVDNVARLTLIEYGKYNYIVSTKVVVPSSTKVDIYQEIDERLIQLFFFIPLKVIQENLVSQIPLPKVSTTSSLVGIVVLSDVLHLLETYGTVITEKEIIDGRYIINVIPGEPYIAYYHRFREADEVPKADLPLLKELLEINLLENLLSYSKLLGETIIRSVSISGMSISFGFPSIEEYKRSLKERKDNLFKRLLPIIETEVETF